MSVHSYHKGYRISIKPVSIPQSELDGVVTAAYYEDDDSPYSGLYWDGALYGVHVERACKRCGKGREGVFVKEIRGVDEVPPYGTEEYFEFVGGPPDDCLGVLPGVKGACCGHGELSQAYVYLMDGTHLRGQSALDYIESVKRGEVSEQEV